MIGGHQLRLAGGGKAVANYNKTPGKSPGYQATLSIAGLSGQVCPVAPTFELTATSGFMEIDADSENDCRYCG
jgi:hypothetical protein